MPHSRERVNHIVPTSKVNAVKFLSKDVFELVLERDAMDFQPGDCFAISNRDGVSRPCSASSGNNQAYPRFAIRRMPNGRVSRWLERRGVRFTRIHREVFFNA